MYRVTIDLSNYDELFGIGKSKQLDKLVKNLLRKEAMTLRDYYVNNHEFRNRTGSLERAIKYQVSKNLTASVFLSNDRVSGKQNPKRPNRHRRVYDYAEYVIYGQSPHIIKPTTPGGRLNFFWERLGKWVTCKQVNHPGAYAEGIATFDGIPSEVRRKFNDLEYDFLDEIIDTLEE